MRNARSRITMAAMTLFKEKGYKETSVTDICRACGITKGTFYYHFPNKDEITYEYYNTVFSEFVDTLPELLLLSNAKDQLWRVYEFTIDKTIQLTSHVLYALMLSDFEKGLTFFSSIHRC